MCCALVLVRCRLLFLSLVLLSGVVGSCSGFRRGLLWLRGFGVCGLFVGLVVACLFRGLLPGCVLVCLCLVLGLCVGCLCVVWLSACVVLLLVVVVGLLLSVVFRRVVAFVVEVAPCLCGGGLFFMRLKPARKTRLRKSKLNAMLGGAGEDQVPPNPPSWR